MVVDVGLMLSHLQFVRSQLLIYFINGSNHKVVVCYLELYEEGEVKHINGV